VAEFLEGKHAWEFSQMLFTEYDRVKFQRQWERGPTMLNKTYSKLTENS